MSVGLIASFVLLFAMLIKRHETPLNYILLAAWTVVEAYTVATVGRRVDIRTI
jgi:FtsH-binding integral membrane protein